MIPNLLMEGDCVLDIDTLNMTKNQDVPELSDDEALKNFLLDIECLNPLAEWTGKFNLFDILKITRTEIRHSNMLAWLLSPNENHGLGDSILRGFVQYVITAFSDDADVFKTLLMDFHGFIIQREWQNIDILAISDDEKFVLCIENKIDASEHDNQLNRYRKDVEKTYPDYKRMFIYLSPDGTEASDSDNWCSMSYTDVLSIIENARKKTRLLPDPALLIDNYLDTIRRDIVGDEELTRICLDIYAKHQKALDLIFENRPDKASNLAETIKKWAVDKTAKGEITVDENKCNKAYIRFTTDYMSSIMPESETPDSGWNTKNHYYYEVKNIEGNAFYIQLSFSARNMTTEQRTICDKINRHSPAKHKKENWQWRVCFSSKRCKVKEDSTEEKIFEALNEQLKELQGFEGGLKAYLASQASANQLATNQHAP